MTLPLVSVAVSGTVAVSFALSLDEPLLEVLSNVSANSLAFERRHVRMIGGDSPVVFTSLLFAHAADWRPGALRCLC